MSKTLLRAESPNLPDMELARRVADGDDGAFERLMRRYNRTLFRTARGILRDDAEAEDAVQEAYLQAYRAMGRYRGEARLSTWLARIVANEALMRLRRQSRRSVIVPILPGIPEEETEQITEANMRKDPETAAQRAEIRKILEDRIDALPGSYRAVFVLRAIEAYSVEETAAILQTSEATVRSRFFRARSLLREGLASEIDRGYDEVFPFAGERCDRIVARVVQRLAGTPGDNP
jgi:RNA polymerase sigma-70 factor (ECF subfamily)